MHSTKILKQDKKSIYEMLPLFYKDYLRQTIILGTEKVSVELIEKVHANKYMKSTCLI